jgi:hypothetical protein
MLEDNDMKAIVKELNEMPNKGMRIYFFNPVDVTEQLHEQKALMYKTRVLLLKCIEDTDNPHFYKLSYARERGGFTFIRDNSRLTPALTATEKAERYAEWRDQQRAEMLRSMENAKQSYLFHLARLQAHDDSY